jgi:hypothetical protein
LYTNLYAAKWCTQEGKEEFNRAMEDDVTNVKSITMGEI